ncbi:MAG: HAMP domain-containing sensor histidine kinase [Rhizobiaceae bacterium]|nr:HAMP domain-containing sensor histidine kinase [Rhizobiaceae bacterium]
MSNAIENNYENLAAAVDDAVADSSVSVSLTDAELNVLNSIPGAIAIFAANGALVWTSEQAEKLVCLRPPLLEQINPQSQVEFLQAVSRAARDKVSSSAIVKLQHVGNTGKSQTVTLEVNCSYFGPEASIYAEGFSLAIINDISHQFGLETQLAEAKQENEDKNTFFSSMSHELRTPLNAIIGFAEMLEGKAPIQLDDHKRLEYAGLISGSANHLLGLINDILDLSRLDAGKNSARKEWVDLEATLQTTVRSMMPIAMNKGIDLIIEDLDTIPHLFTDKRALTQILTNVLSNAVKFSHHDGVVRAKVVRLRNRLKIVISDKGIGMSADTQSKLGGLFYQSGDVISGDYGGSGLGLSIVYKLVELLGGKIAISSRLHEGTIVSIILPTGSDQAMPVPARSNDEVVYLSEAREQTLPNTVGKSVSSGVRT